ncbi:MAG: hypothetical protein H7839_21140 [Magnetococcus sp. YQC-5]
MFLLGGWQEGMRISRHVSVVCLFSDEPSRLESPTTNGGVKMLAGVAACAGGDSCKKNGVQVATRKKTS